MSKYSPEVEALVPESFCLGKYENSKKLDLYKWYNNILQRKMIEDFFMVRHPAYMKEDTALSINQKNILHGFLEDDITHWLADVDEDHELLVKSMTASSVNRVLKEIEYKGDDPTKLNASFEHYLRSLNMFTPAWISLDAPDEILIDNFKKWLKKTRHTKGTKLNQKLITTSTLRRWHSNKALEYLDLSQWYRLRGKTLHDYQAAEILFPNDLSRNTTDVVTKTIRKKIVPEILSEETGSALIHQAIETNWKENN